MTNLGRNNSSKNIKIVPLRNKYIRSKVIKKYLGDDQLFMDVINRIDRLYSLGLRKQGLLFNFKHMKKNGEIISLVGHDIEYE